MNIKRSLCCLFVALCCLPVLSIGAQDSTSVLTPVATLLDPVTTVLPGQDATAAPGGAEATEAPGGPDGAIPTNDSGAIGSSTQMPDAMATSEMMGTMEAIMTPDDPNTQTIGDILDFQAESSTPEFTMLRQALIDADLLDTLKDNTVKYVVFAPTDAAFQALSEDTLTTVTSDPQMLHTALLNHVVLASEIWGDMGTMATMEPGAMATADMMATMEPMATQDMSMSTMEPGAMATTEMMATMEPGMTGCMSSTMGSDMLATMEPGAMATAEMMATMEPGAMATADMMATMEPGAMSDDMMWHDVTSMGGLVLTFGYEDGCLTVNGARILAKVNASNGTIYVIDQVLTSDMAMATMEPGTMATQDMTMSTMEAPMATMEATEAP